MGLAQPETLADWARVDLGANNLPWLSGESFQRLERSIRYFLLHNRLNRAQRKSRSRAFHALARLLRKPLQWPALRQRDIFPPADVGFSRPVAFTRASDRSTCSFLDS
jgi:hypothetical protein